MRSDRLSGCEATAARIDADYYGGSYRLPVL